MPTSPVKTRIPLTSFGHLITEVKRQLFGIETPAPAELTVCPGHLRDPAGGRSCLHDAQTKQRGKTDIDLHSLRCRPLLRIFYLD
ncbi:uncharacterized protein ACNS7B_008012 isoform 2-T2 [Menidia menidia]